MKRDERYVFVFAIWFLISHTQTVNIHAIIQQYSLTTQVYKMFLKIIEIIVINYFLFIFAWSHIVSNCNCISHLIYITNSVLIFDDIFGFSIVSDLSMYHVRNKLYSLKMIVFICYFVVTLLHLRYGCLITGNTPTVQNGVLQRMRNLILTIW